MTILPTIKKSFKLLNWKLLSAIFATLFIPILYYTTRMFFIGTIPGNYNFSIAGNLQWINVLFEILEESFLLPLFFSLRRIMKMKDKKEQNQKISFLIFLISITYLICITFFVIFTKQMMQQMSVQQITLDSIQFVKIEFITRFFIMFGKITAILIIAKAKWHYLLSILFANTLINICLDLFIVSNSSVSLKKGVVWIAYNQLISSLIIFAICFLFIVKIYQFKFNHLIPKIFFDWQILKQNIFSGLESFIRNAFFIWFVIKVINRLDTGYSQGDFWVMNSFIWGWLLLPILTISQYLNRDQAFNNKTTDIKTRLAAPMLIILITIGLWFATIPLYKPFIQYVINNNHYKIIANLTIISLGFYVCMAINDPIDKIFYGDGKAHFLLIQSLITNVAVYIPYYFLSELLSIYDVAIMMGTAIAVDSLLTFMMFIWWYKKQIKNNVSNIRYQKS